MVSKTVWASFLIVLIIVGVAAYFVGDYFGYQRAQVPTKSFWEQIKEKGKIVVGTSADYPPYEYINTTTQKIEGFDIDFVNAIAGELGITVEWKDMSFDALWGALESGTIDMIAAATFLTDERADRYEYSVPYYVPTQALFVRSDSNITIEHLWDIGELGITVGVQSATTEDDLLMEQVNAGNMSESQIHRYDKADVIVQDVVNGQIDAGFIDKPPVEVFAKTYPIKIIFEVPAEPCVLFMPKGAVEFRNEVNKAIVHLMKDGTIASLMEKWFAGI
ncbi:hypothetical protein DRO19_00225 [Candidatus Bathyarchaeota archaeon]|nr:MAG: hypothetical protein DRO19_00225 [Candidatus Bathyarchaeota archaeon]